jgi:hypothetical protein
MDAALPAPFSQSFLFLESSTWAPIFFPFTDFSLEFTRLRRAEIGNSCGRRAYALLLKGGVSTLSPGPVAVLSQAGVYQPQAGLPV